MNYNFTINSMTQIFIKKHLLISNRIGKNGGFTVDFNSSFSSAAMISRVLKWSPKDFLSLILKAFGYDEISVL